MPCRPCKRLAPGVGWHGAGLRNVGRHVQKWWNGSHPPFFPCDAHVDRNLDRCISPSSPPSLLPLSLLFPIFFASAMEFVQMDGNWIAIATGLGGLTDAGD